jgi:hypothetical protein
MRRIWLLAALVAAACSKRPEPAEDPSFGCTPLELHRGETLTVRLPLPHGEDLAVLDPDGRLFYVAVYQDGAGKRPGLEPAVDRVAFRRMDRLITSSTTAEGAPQQGSGGGRKPIFTRSGPYRIVLGDNLGTPYAAIEAECQVRYLDTERPG